MKELTHTHILSQSQFKCQHDWIQASVKYYKYNIISLFCIFLSHHRKSNQFVQQSNSAGQCPSKWSFINVQIFQFLKSFQHTSTQTTISNNTHTGNSIKNSFTVVSPPDTNGDIDPVRKLSNAAIVISSVRVQIDAGKRPEKAFQPRNRRSNFTNLERSGISPVNWLSSRNISSKAAILEIEDGMLPLNLLTEKSKTYTTSSAASAPQTSQLNIIKETTFEQITKSLLFHPCN